MGLRIGKMFMVALLLVSALAQIANGQSRNPRAVEHLNTAIDLKKKGDLISAEAHYREAIRIDPSYAEAHYSFAILLADRGDI